MPLSENKSFCILPWIHTHIMPNGTVIPCCITPYDDIYGNLRTESLEDVWNNTRYKELRKNMLNDVKTSGCQRCYELEDSNIISNRQRFNNRFKHHLYKVNETNEDGSFKNLEMNYFDMRFSNICNFKCRGCSPELSSAWYSDHQAIYEYDLNRPQVIDLKSNYKDMWSDIDKFLPFIEETYFAGGEPLLHEEHYMVLEKLIDKNRTDTELSYNTNLSVLKFKKYDLVDLWSKFKQVSLSVSLDDIGLRAEYFRSGTNWKILERNLIKVKNEIKNAYISVTCTISIFNILYLPEVHFYLYSNGFIGENDFHMNTLLDPDEYRVQVLSSELKETVKRKLLSYLKILSSRYPDADWNVLEHSFKSTINFMMKEDRSNDLDAFFSITDKLDEVRKESFSKVYPELNVMRKSSHTELQI